MRKFKYCYGFYCHKKETNIEQGKETHHKILLKNPIKGRFFERYKTKSKPILTYDEKATDLIFIVNTDNKIPTGGPTRIFRW